MSPHSSFPVFQFTQEKYDEMRAEVRRLLAYREEVMARLKIAREMGDLSENGAYKYAKFELGDIRRKLRDLNHYLEHGVILKKPTQNEVVQLGSHVTVEVDGSEKEFFIVNRFEADPSLGKISDLSPIGSALVGKKVGEQVPIDLPKNQKVYTIKSIT
jgi:transcription elongation factor GreA